MYHAKIDVTLKKSILDPQGQTTLQALQTLGFRGVKDMRVGKHFILTLEAKNEDEAKQAVSQMCEKLLVNPVIEQYTVQLEEAGAAIK